MGAFICKQPNGKYCRFSTFVDSVTHWNMTEEEYVEFCAERARREAREVLEHHLRPFSDIKKFFCPNNYTVEDFNAILKEMGDTEQLNPKDYGEEQ